MRSEVEQELLRLTAEHDGELDVDVLIDAARPKSSILHGEFNWDPDYNIRRSLRDQARGLIQRYRVQYIAGDTEEREVRGFVSVRKNDDPGKHTYVLTTKALSDPVMHDEVLADLRRDLATLRKKYGHLEEYARIVREAVESDLSLA